MCHSFEKVLAFVKFNVTETDNFEGRFFFVFFFIFQMTKSFTIPLVSPFQHFASKLLMLV
jgi:hypothetical protein